MFPTYRQYPTLGWGLLGPARSRARRLTWPSPNFIFFEPLGEEK